MSLNSKTKTQILRFIPVGIANTLIDWSVLNLLLFFTKTEELFVYSVFKAISFSVAVIASYFLNKRFVFQETDSAAPTASLEKYKKFGFFFGISFIAALLNIFTASLTANACYQQLNLDNRLFIFCANFGAVLGTAIAAIWNFIGYKKIVFRE
ncbi:MAG: GtrA family protein [Patescibacteria group bacterium]